MTPWLARAKCAEKTARGNLFRYKQKAKRAASNWSRTTGKKIDWFRCKCCGMYHLGRHERKERVRV